MTRTDAKAYLTRRHAEMTVRYPVGMREVPLDLYLRRNLAGAMKMSGEVAKVR